MDTPILRREQRKRQRMTKYLTVIRLCKQTGIERRGLFVVVRGGGAGVVAARVWWRSGVAALP